MIFTVESNAQFSCLYSRVECTLQLQQESELTGYSLVVLVDLVVVPFKGTEIRQNIVVKKQNPYPCPQAKQTQRETPAHTQIFDLSKNLNTHRHEIH